MFGFQVLVGRNVYLGLRVQTITDGKIKLKKVRYMYTQNAFNASGFAYYRYLH